MTESAISDRLVRRLERFAPLDEADRAAVAALPCSLRTIEAPGYVLREGDPVRTNCAFLLSGYAFRQKLTANGTRQIVALHMAGDFLDLQHLFLGVADHSVQALTRLEIANVSRDGLQDLALDRPAVGRALWIEGLIEASIYREWVLNVGRRDARARIAHLLCEFAVRMDNANIAPRDACELPMTQEQLGDAVGLTSVHVNRTLRALVLDGLVEYDRRRLRILDWARLVEAGDFSALYLHLSQDQSARAA